jgi:hypothetical protein
LKEAGVLRAQRAQWKLWQVSIAVVCSGAVLGCILRFGPMTFPVWHLIVYSIVYLFPPGKRLGAAFWIAGYYPILLVFLLHVAYVAKYYLLGSGISFSWPDSPMLDALLRNININCWNPTHPVRRSRRVRGHPFGILAFGMAAVGILSRQRPVRNLEFLTELRTQFDGRSTGK